jgi:hypothetical protein
MLKSIAFIVGLVVLAQCSSNNNSSKSAPSDIAGSTVLSALTSSQLGEICDWGASYYGGYGKTYTCDDAGSTTSDGANQAACIAQLQTQLAGCTAMANATYQQLLNCLQPAYANNNVCTADTVISTSTACTFLQGSGC